MAARKRTGSHPDKVGQSGVGKPAVISSAIHAAIGLGFVVGREVLVGTVPGIVVGYNIASFGNFVGSDFPLVVRTALGVTKCSPAELRLV